MSWTEERVERLSRLWMQGQSASQIAGELGNGVSRNAVIGKIHRLGLSGRNANAPQPDADRAKGVKPTVAASPAKPAVRFQPPVELPAAAAPTFPIAQAMPISDVVIPMTDRVTIMELRETMCRWPLGDPTSAEFRFCGCRTSGAIPYCTAHARVAFQPVAERRRMDRVVRIA